MASSKDTFEPKTFASNSFACGAFRGVGASVASITQWSPIHYRSPNRRLEHRSPNKTIQLNKKS